MKRLRTLGPVFAIFLTAACGGGGGGGGGAPATGDNGSGGGRVMASITTANAEEIAAVVMKSAFESVELNAVSSYQTNVTLTKPSPSISEASSIEGRQLKALQRDGSIARFQAPISPIEFDCELGGMWTLSGDVESSNAIAVDDHLIATWAECEEPDLYVDGSVTMTVTAYSFTEPDGPEALGILIDIDQLEVTTPDESRTADGSMTSLIEIASGTPPLSSTITITSDGMTLSGSGETETLTAFEMIGTIAFEPLAIGYELSGTLSSTRVTGEVDFETNRALSLSPPLLSDGEIVITGAAGSSITIIALAATATVRVEVDTNGDGTVDTSFDRSFDELII